MLVAEVENTARLHPDELRYDRPHVYLSISDCSNVCRLEFGLDGSERRRNSLYKIDTLIKGLERFRTALKEEAELARQRERATGRDERDW